LLTIHTTPQKIKGQKAKGKRQKSIRRTAPFFQSKNKKYQVPISTQNKRKNKVPTFCLLPFAFCLLLSKTV
jgi:hypothetical protein